jgi:beta-glucanase (GH16 family)
MKTKSIFFKKLVIITLITFTGFTSQKLHSQCKRLIWAEEFDVNGTPNPSNWSYETGAGGWGNAESQNYTNRAANSIVENGVLKIIVKKEKFEGSDYTSARLVSKGKRFFKYGRVETRAKFPAGVGTWPAIWMLGSNIDKPEGTWPACGEIDIAEHVGKDLNKIYGTLHYPERNGANADGNTTLIENATTAFHDYALDWTASSIKIYVDNKLYHTVPNSNAIPFNQDFFFILNIAIGGSFGGPIDPAFTSAAMEIDYIRVYEGGYTVSGATNVVEKQVKSYSIESIPGVTYNWSVPAGATIVSGNGTNAIVVNWGSTSGKVSVTTTVTGSCPAGVSKESVYTLPVVVAKTSLIYEDYELNRNITFNAGTGTYNAKVPNPNVTGNTSVDVGKYVRNAGQQYDNFSFVTTINNTTEFKASNKKFALDVYTTAPVGTQIIWQLENAAKATGNYPLGRHSTYTAVVEKVNAWHTLIFNYTSSPDQGTLDNEVNRFVLLCNPNSNTDNVYYFDNLRSIDTAPLSTVNFDDYSNEIAILPNPTDGVLNIVIPNLTGSKEVTLFDVPGRTIIKKVFSDNLNDYVVDMSNIPSGIYVLTLKCNGKTWSKKVVKS